MHTDPYGPFAGPPEHVRFDRGRDFLSRALTTALNALNALDADATVPVLAPYGPHLKGGTKSTCRSSSPPAEALRLTGR
ncbi:hypothetical protein ACWGR4_42465 [Embleya sp. NPDC055664]